MFRALNALICCSRGLSDRRAEADDISISDYKIPAVGNIFFLLVLLLMQQSLHAELNDPTMPYGYSPSAAVKSEAMDQQKITLAGIIRGPKGLSAVIEGKRLSAGQSIHGRKIIAVHRDHVVLGMGGQRKKVYLLNQTFKKRALKSNGGEK